MHQLTPRQEQFLRVFAKYNRKHGFPPTFREMARAMGFASVSEACLQKVHALIRKGLLERRSDYQARAIVLTEAGRRLAMKLEGATHTLDTPFRCPTCDRDTFVPHSGACP